MAELIAQDVTKCLAALPAEVESLLRANPRDVVLAGGFLRDTVAGEAVRDVDLFTRPELSLACARSLLVLNRELPCKVYNSEHAVTVTGLSRPVQLCHGWSFDAPEHLVELFDFTVSKAGIWCERGGELKSYASDHFYQDLRDKRLRYDCPERDELPGGSLLRTLKLCRRGYKISLDSLAKVVARFVCQSEDWRRRYAEDVDADDEQGLSELLSDTLHVSDSGSDGGLLDYFSDEEEGSDGR